MKKTKVKTKSALKMLLKLTAAVLSVVMMLCALPLGALASEVRTAPTSLENGVTVEKPQSQKVYDGEMLAGVENIDTSLSETEPTSPLTELELSSIIKNGKMERITADNVPDAVGFESAKSKNHVARAFEKEKDELNSLVFLNEDGTYTKYLYDYPVKFVDESGSIKDTSLDIVAEANGSYKRKQGGTAASFSKKVTDGIKLSGDGASISLYPKIPTQVRQPVVTGKIGKLPLKSLLYSAENINSLDKKTVSYYYNDSTSLEYSLTYTGFKEDIVVSEYTGQTEYVFTLKTGGLTLTEDNGNFYLTDKNGNTKATLGQIIIFTADERNNTFGSMSAVAVKENEEYTVTIHVDAEYLKDEKTVYPIRIDPTIELTENGTSLVEDVVVNSNDTVSHRTTEALRVGKNEDGTYSRILIKFNYDFGSFADGPLKIHRAYVEMRDVMCQTESMTVMSEMYVGTNWSEDADWSAIARGMHTHYMASMPINYNKGNGYTEKHRYSISVLDAVKYWVAEANNTPDYYQASPQGGIMIKAYDAVEQGTTPIQKYFASSQYAETAYRPSLAVTYYDTHTQYSDPFGHLDAVTSNSIRGWVWCVDLPKQSVPVTIYLKNKTTGEDYPPINLSGKDTALYRPDVHDGDYGTGCYGFNYPIDWNRYPAGQYEVRAKWHSMNGTTLQSDLFNSPKMYDNININVNPFYSNSNDIQYYINSGGLDTDDNLQRRSNCYGFALKMFYAEEEIAENEYTNNGEFYKQQPGEFADRTSFLSVSEDISYYYALCLSYLENMIANNGLTVDFIINMVDLDMEAMGYDIIHRQKYVSSSQVPTAGTYTDRRLIALVVGGGDYHFYMQNSDGIWTHKPGEGIASKTCFEHGETLKDSNIVEHIRESIYLDDYVFFYVNKPATIDFGHYNGTSDSCIQTDLYSCDGVGDTAGSAKLLECPTSSYVVSRIGYINDIDYYCFEPQASKSYNFEFMTIDKNQLQNHYELRVNVLDNNLNVLETYSISTGTGNCTLSLTAGKQYYLMFWSCGQTEYESDRLYKFKFY
ncbi:MAG: hypothetical protein IJA41_06600 [Clostridia bacterium]|nr:hypothetical protein [Clostridia bacterium]